MLVFLGLQIFVLCPGFENLDIKASGQAAWRKVKGKQTYVKIKEPVGYYNTVSV